MAARQANEINAAKTMKEKIDILEEHGWNSDDGGQTLTQTINGVPQKLKLDTSSGEYKLVKTESNSGSSNDAACEEKQERQLTGDCKIRVRKETTEDAKRYNPGDISEKTGLQKQSDGSWKKPKSGNPGKEESRSATKSTEESKPAPAKTKSSIDIAHEETDGLDRKLKGLSMPAMSEKLEELEFESDGVKQVNGTTMEVFKKDYGNVTATVVTWQKGTVKGSATKIFNKGHEQRPTGVLHNMNIHGVIWS